MMDSWENAQEAGHGSSTTQVVVGGNRSQVDKFLKLQIFFLLCLIGIFSDKDSLIGDKNYLYIIFIAFSDYKSNTYMSSQNFGGLSKKQLNMYLKE